MKSLLRTVLLVASALCLIGASYAQVPVDEDVVGVADSDARYLDLFMFPMTENQTNLRGTTSDVTNDPLNYCFDGVLDQRFFRNEIVSMNVFFDDTVEADQFNEYVVTWAIIKRGVVVPVGTFDCMFDVSAVPPGTPMSFCCSIIDEIPALPLPLDVGWGARVVKSENGFTVQGNLGGARVGP